MISISKGYNQYLLVYLNTVFVTLLILSSIRWLPGVEKQSTDVHYRSINGEGLFNWRFKFLFPYNKTENTIIHKIRDKFSFDNEEQTFLPRLHLQIWDDEQLSLDSYIGKLNIFP